ncbi:MAG: hypothetical protein M3O70_16445 [Actinomycetota bacterium]|nr:hypothetical protein [Actinomycetota bacterium]
MTESEQDRQEPEEQEGFGWFGVPPGPVVNREEMEAAAAVRPYEDMDPLEFQRRLHEGLLNPQRDIEEWRKRQAEGKEDAG